MSVTIQSIGYEYDPIGLFGMYPVGNLVINYKVSGAMGIYQGVSYTYPGDQFTYGITFYPYFTTASATQTYEHPLTSAILGKVLTIKKDNVFYNTVITYVPPIVNITSIVNGYKKLTINYSTTINGISLINYLLTYSTSSDLSTTSGTPINASIYTSTTASYDLNYPTIAYNTPYYFKLAGKAAYPYLDYGDDAFFGPVTLEYTVPDAPTINNITPGNATVTIYYTLNWNGGMNDITTMYVTYSTNSTFSSSTSIPFNGTSPYTLSNGVLTNGIAHYFKLQTYNEVGGSEVTTYTINGTTAPVTPVFPVPLAPVVTDTGLFYLPSSGEIRAEFFPSDANGSTITGYQYRLSINGGSWSNWSDIISAVIVTNPFYYNYILIYTREYGKEYSVQLRAYSSDGGAGTEATFGYSNGAINYVTPYTVPEAPTNLIITYPDTGSGQIIFSFSQPSSDGYNTIQYYKYSKDGTNYDQVNLTSENNNYTSISTTSGKLIGLTIGTTFTLYIKAYNSAGLGSPTSASVTPYTTPGAPTGLNIAYPGSGQIIFSFKPPSSNGYNTIQYYKYSKDGTNYDQVNLTSGNYTSISTTSGKLSGLTNGITFTLYIKAYNSAGLGSPTSKSATPSATASYGTGVITANSLYLTGYLNSYSTTTNQYYINSITNSNYNTTGLYLGNLVSVNASYIISSGVGFTINSDQRIKKNSTPLSSTESLQIVKTLKPCQYQYIDFMKGSVSKYGYLAQEVEAVIPNVVNRNPSYIPNFFEMVKIEDHNKIILHEKNTESLVIGTKVQFYDIQNEIHIREVLDVIDDKSFLVSESFIDEIETLFLYGQFVEDYRSIDTDQINTILLSALQECNKKIEKQEKELDDLEKLLDEL